MMSYAVCVFTHRIRLSIVLNIYFNRIVILIPIVILLLIILIIILIVNISIANAIRFSH